MSDSGGVNEPPDALIHLEDDLLAEAIRLNDAANAAVIAAAEELVAVHPPLVDTEMIDATNSAPVPPHAAAASIPKSMPDTQPFEPHIYFLLKMFDGKLRSRGSHLAKRTERIDKTVVRILQLDKESEQKMELFEETNATVLAPLRRGKTFKRYQHMEDDIRDGAIIIACFPTPEDIKEAVSSPL